MENKFTATPTRTYQYKENEYNVLNVGKQKENGVWYDAVIYCPTEVKNPAPLPPPIYSRRKEEFEALFIPSKIEEGDTVGAFCMGKLLGLYRMHYNAEIFKWIGESDTNSGNVITLENKLVNKNGTINVSSAPELEHLLPNVDFLLLSPDCVKTLEKENWKGTIRKRLLKVIEDMLEELPREEVITQTNYLEARIEERRKGK